MLLTGTMKGEVAAQEQSYLLASFAISCKLQGKIYIVKGIRTT